MSNSSRKFRRQCRREERRAKRPRQWSVTICADPDPNCPTCRELMRVPGARCEQSEGVRTILIPI